MSEKPTYEELEQRIRELELSAADLRDNTTFSKPSEQMYKHCFENANIGVCLTDPDGNFLSVNNRMVEIFGYSKKEFEGMNVDDVSHTEDITISKEVQRRTKAGESEHNVFQKRYIHKNGHLFWGKVSNSIVRDNDEKPLYFVTHFTEITENKKAFEKLQRHQNELDLLVYEQTKKLSQANEALKKHKALLEATGRMANVGGWELDAKTMEVTWTDATYRIHEVPLDYKPSLKKAINFFHPEDKPKLENVIQRALDHGEPYDLEIRFITAKGNHLWTRTTCEAEIVEGKVIRLKGTFQDISERKQAEEALRESESRFRKMVEMLPEAVFETDKELNLIFVNQQAFNIFEYSQQDFDSGLNGFDMLAPKDRDRAFENIAKRFQGEEFGSSEYLGMRKDGSTFPILLHANPILRKGAIDGVRGIIVDLSERKKIEAQARQAQKMQSVGALAGGIAHDFNNILSSIIGFTELAIDEVPKDSSLDDSLQEIYSAGIRAKDLVRQILAFARQSDEKRSPIQPITITKEVLKLIRSTIPTIIEIRQNLASDSWIMGNPTEIHQVLMNLCTNAAHAMEDSGGVLDVRLNDIVIETRDAFTGMMPGDYVEIKVSDTGIGIAPEIIDSIFDPYFTTKRSGEGTGMGLAITQGVIESYSGKITVDSQLKKGTTFTICLPITKKRSGHDAYVPDQLPTGTERILFVDDEAPIAKMGSQILERLGYSVTIRTSSVEALELFQAKPNGFDLVVTDMTMPNLSGDKLAIELMKIRPNIPVILCTGYSKKISDETASEIGVKAFAYKPVVKADLAKTVRKVLDEASKIEK